MTQEQGNKPKQDEAPQEVEPVDLQNEALSDEVDDLLADIDDVLEENAQDFVQSFVQQGGQ